MQQTRAIALVGPMAVPADLTLQQLRVLDHVAKQPGLSGQELGALLGVSAPTARPGHRCSPPSWSRSTPTTWAR